MRRAMLLITGLGTGGILFALLLVSVAEQYTVVKAQELPPVTLVFPYPVTGTTLHAVALVEYEGPFWEDGSDEEVAGIAALLVKNAGDLQIARGAVILEWEDKRMVFEMTSLPPGTQALVLEKDKAAFRQGAPKKCYGWAREEYPEYNGAVQVREGDVLTVINLTESVVPMVTVCFKNYDAAADMFIGGITYTAEARQLQPGECRTIAPYHYVCGNSRVVSITTAVIE